MIHDDAAILRLMRQTLQLHTALWSESVPELTKSQWSVLRAVFLFPENDQNSVGELTAIDKATLVPLIDRLMERGLLTRVPDPRDGRRRRLLLTAKGRKTVERNEGQVAKVNSATMAGLDTKERAELRALLTRVVEKVGEPPAASMQFSKDD